MTKVELNYIKDAFSQIIDDISGNPDWYEAARAVASDLGTLERELEEKISPLPSNLDEAAEKYCSDNTPLGATCRACFRDGAEWMAGQGVTEEYDVDEDGIFLDSDSLGVCLTAWPPSELHCEEGDTLIIQMRKRKSGESLNEKEDD
jgi:hypothetical protein